MRKLKKTVTEYLDRGIQSLTANKDVQNFFYGQ